jgi:hypothetical protein
MALEEPTPEQHAHLMADPESRVGRRAQRIGERSLASVRHRRGRRRPEIGSIDQLPLYNTNIDASRIIALGKYLKGKQPIFDKFTDHYRVRPTKDSIEQYVSAGNKNRRETRSSDHTKQREIFRSMQRQTQHQADLLQQSVLDDLNIARRRRASLHAIRFQVGHDQAFDPDAAREAADAVWDFGQGLSANKDMLRDVHDEGLGEVIAAIGTQAMNDPEVLRQNPYLLRLTQIEQAARVEHWQAIFEATEEHILGDRLTVDHYKRANETELELARLDTLCQA